MNDTLGPRAFAWAIILVIPSAIIYNVVGQDWGVRIGFGTLAAVLAITGLLTLKDVE